MAQPPKYVWVACGSARYYSCFAEDYLPEKSVLKSDQLQTEVYRISLPDRPYREEDDWENEYGREEFAPRNIGPRFTRPKQVPEIVEHHTQLHPEGEMNAEDYLRWAA